jgi:hypothetical protein
MRITYSVTVELDTDDDDVANLCDVDLFTALHEANPGSVQARAGYVEVTRWEVATSFVRRSRRRLPAEVQVVVDAFCGAYASEPRTVRGH